MPSEKNDKLNPWCITEAPLPSNTHELIAVIKHYAAVRRGDARTHRSPCPCGGCATIRYDKLRRELGRYAA